MTGPGVEDAAGLLQRLVVDVPDYPEPGVVFKDITPVLADPAAFVVVIEALADDCAHIELQLASKNVPMNLLTRIRRLQIPFAFRYVRVVFVIA